MSHRNGPQNLHYHNAIKSTSTSAVYMPSSNIISEPLTDKYTVGENIGRGKFAVVRKCINKETNEVVAAKFIKKRRRGKSCREEILREVVMLEMALEHPRLVNLKEVYETQQELVLITEYCAGGELFTECILEEKFNEADVRLIMAQILEGMAFLHEKNIVHLDLKPQNILLTDEFPKGSIKICDLGFACLVNTGEDIRDIIGTPDYVAPEVLNYDPLGLYTDMWSLGVLTYVMLTTCSPFAGEDSTLTFSNITNVNLDFPDELFAEISMAAQDFIQKLLIAEPSERMTAKECFNHKWLSGIESPCKPLTGAETPNFTVTENRDTEENANVTGEAQDVSNITWTDRSLQSSRESSRDDLDDVSRKSFSSSRESSRDKIANQASEMSVIEGKEDEGIGIDSEADIEADELVEIANSTKDTECDTEDSSSIDKSTEDKVTETSNKDFINEDSAFDNLDLVSTEQPEKSVRDTELTPELITSELKTPELITPETDSSMCISENKLPETDSGLMTGSECKSIESVDISGRISADQESENIDTDFNSETNDDIEMMNKSSLDVKDMGGGDESNLSSIAGEENAGNNKMETKRVFGIISEEMNVTDELTMSENEMEVENSLAGNGDKVLQTNENNSAKSLANETEHSNYKFNFSSVDNTQMSMDVNTGNSTFTKEQPRDQVGNKTVPTTSFGDFIKDDKYAILPGNVDSKRQNSVGGIDDSINSMQLAERHKRGMCNDSTSPGVDKPASDDTEYEFVSVTKRVRSIEDSMATRSPPFSPKIARSPRITRHSRNNHLQHH